MRQPGFRTLVVSGGAALVAALTACPPHAPQGPPRPLAAEDSVRTEAWGAVPDPVGFLLEYHDSLNVSDSQLDALRSINLDLFRHNAKIQMSIDSLVPPPPPGFAYGRHPPELTPDQRALLEHLVTARRDNIRGAKADADSVLTPEQRTQADSLRARIERRNGRRPPR